MKSMVNCLLIAGLVMVCGCAYAQDGGLPAPSPAETTRGPYRVGDVLHVHARSGLTLRRSGFSTGEKIGLIAYGQAVTVISLPYAKNRFVAEKYGSCEVVGYWPKVRTVDGQEGYVFDGYLFRYPTMKEEPEEGMDYGDAFYGMIAKRQGDPVPYMGDEPGLMSEYSYRQAFDNGAVYTSQYYEGGAVYVFETPKGAHTAGELLVMLRSFFYTEAVNTKWDEAEKAVVVTPVEEGYSFLKIRETADGGLRAEFAVAD